MGTCRGWSGLLVLPAVGLVTSACYSGAVLRWPSGAQAGEMVPTVISLPRACRDVAFSDGVVWAFGDGLFRIDPATNGVVETIPTANRRGVLGRIAVEGDTVWLSIIADQVLRIDTKTKQIVARIPDLSGALAIGEGAVWITNRLAGGNAVARVDPGTNTVVTTIEVGKSPVAVAAGAGGVWVLQTDGSIIRIDPQTNRVVSKTQIGERVFGGVSGSDIVVGAGAVWVANATDGSVSRVDPVTNQVVANISLGRGLRDLGSRIRVSEEGVWVASGGASSSFFAFSKQIAKIEPTTLTRLSGKSMALVASPLQLSRSGLVRCGPAGSASD